MIVNINCAQELCGEPQRALRVFKQPDAVASESTHGLISCIRLLPLAPLATTTTSCHRPSLLYQKLQATLATSVALGLIMLLTMRACPTG